MQRISLKNILKELESQDNFVFLETKKVTPQDFHSYIFTNPINIISSNSPSEIKPALSETEKFLKEGFFIAGFISYDAGFSFEEALFKKKDYNFPLLWFGVYDRPIIIDHRKTRFRYDIPTGNYRLSKISPDIKEEDYISSIDKIKFYIEKGHTYQVNYTFKLGFGFDGSIAGLYLDLRKKQSVSYSCLMRFGGRYALSFSPEMFFRKRDRMIEVKPMKGTSCRGRFLQEDLGNIEALHLCPKNRSENIMIVDMLRNDLGKISSPATVKTKRFFEVERYESLLQMTSTIEGKLKSKVSLYEIFKALFPSGSVTGAPKIKTMQIIDELEKSPRMVYTGSIGFIKPSGDAVFNVAIRTLLIDTKEKIGEMGVGSGIVYDSNPQKEYAECLLKSKFLTDRWADFQLIETMLWEPQKGLFLLKLHMERLSESARYFDFRYNEKAIVEALRKTAAKLDSRKRYRIRFLLDREGGIDISFSDITIENDEKFVTVSDKATDSKDIFLFHKTTNRRFYDEEYKRCKEKGFHDIIFCNQNGEITEGTISNIFIKKGNRYYTPPVHCGLLNGVYRRYILKEKMLPAQEKILYIEDIERAEEIILTNAVRGITKAKLIREESYVKV